MWITYSKFKVLKLIITWRVRRSLELLLDLYQETNVAILKGFRLVLQIVYIFIYTIFQDYHY